MCNAVGDDSVIVHFLLGYLHRADWIAGNAEICPKSTAQERIAIDRDSAVFQHVEVGASRPTLNRGGQSRQRVVIKLVVAQ